MASKGAFVQGTDGTDFQHRQRVAGHYQTSVLNKGRLKFMIYTHYMLFGLLAIKLMDNILDRLDIFILELQELYIPKPRLWEWLWAAGIVFSWTGLKALKKNNVPTLRMYLIMTFAFCFLPVIYSLIYYFNEFTEFLNTRSIEKVESWRGLPVSVIWYLFLVLALQIHVFQFLFGFNLMSAWAVKKRTD